MKFVNRVPAEKSEAFPLINMLSLIDSDDLTEKRFLMSPFQYCAK